MLQNGNQFNAMYPDVLGAITNGTRISLDKLQIALGVYPKQAAINQPIEIILILQNMIDQMMQVKVGIQLPTEDKKGFPVVIDLAKKTVSLGLRGGEVGVLRIPITPHPPTQAGTQFPVRVAVRFRSASEGRLVRPPTGGAPPSTLSLSSVRLQGLRDIEYKAHTWNQSAEIVTTYFDVLPKRLPPTRQELNARYESLWTHEEMATEREMVEAKRQDALRVAGGLTRSTVYKPVLDIVEEIYARRGMPLHPGETKAIAKIITYALDEGLELEPGFSMEASRWFTTLCQVLAHDELVEDKPKSELVEQYLFGAALHDAIILGFSVIQPKVREDLGDTAERSSYATRLLSWLGGQGDPDLTYVYLPLVMAGVVVNQIVTNRDDNPWIMLDELQEARQGRARLLSGEARVVFKLLDELLLQAEDSLRRARVPRP